jgi:dCMP deaminase
MAYLVAMKSNDPNTKVGAIITTKNNEIISTGYNGFPRGFNNTDDRWLRENKYNYVEHAEKNAIYNAARIGVSTKDCTIYVNMKPCHECIKGIIQAGINLIYYDKNFPKKSSCNHITDEIVKEVGISVIEYDYLLIAINRLCNGEQF